MLSRDARLDLIDYLAQRIRNAREDRVREWLAATFPCEGIGAGDLEKRKTALIFLDKMSDRDLMALGRTLKIAFDPSAPDRLARPSCWKGSDDIRLFVSHRSDRETYAERLANALRAHHFASFVARYQIGVGNDWREEVNRALFTMQAFVSIHTVGLRTAEWPMQEIGVAYGRQVPMLAVVVDEAPGGFAERTQALKVSAATEIGEVAEGIAEFFFTKSQLQYAAGAAKNAPGMSAARN
jgi:TIR domain-containing protein